jgi:acetyl esterase/lipase
MRGPRRLLNDARRYARRLEASGVDASYLQYEDTPHAFLNFPGALSAAWRAMQDIADDLNGFFSLRAPGYGPAPVGEVEQGRHEP